MSENNGTVYSVENNPTKLPQQEALNALIGSFQDKLNSLKVKQAELAAANSQEDSLGLLGSDPTSTYSHIEEALKQGLHILELVKLELEAAPDPNGFTAAASILSSIQPLFREFTSIWNKQLDFQNRVNLESIKLKNQKELEDHKMALKLKFHQETREGNSTNTNQAIPFSTKDFIDAIEL